MQARVAGNDPSLAEEGEKAAEDEEAMDAVQQELDTLFQKPQHEEGDTGRVFAPTRLNHPCACHQPLYTYCIS